MHVNLCIKWICALILINEMILSKADEQRSMLCRRCGETIVGAQQLEHIASKLSLTCTNKTVLGNLSTPVQLFENPQKQRFEVITAKTANINAHEQAYAEATWFPGYAWRVSTCPQCQQHLGWKFQPINFNHVTHTEDDTFVGLILDHLLEEEMSNSLLLVPKSYNS